MEKSLRTVDVRELDYVMRNRTFDWSSTHKFTALHHNIIAQSRCLTDHGNFEMNHTILKQVLPSDVVLESLETAVSPRGSLELDF